MTFKKQNKATESIEALMDEVIAVKEVKETKPPEKTEFEKMFDEFMQRDKRKTLAYMDKFCKQFTNMTYTQLQSYFGNEMFNLLSDNMKDVMHVYLLNLKLAILADCNRFSDTTAANAFYSASSTITFGKLWNSNNRLFFEKDNIKYFVDRNANLYQVKA